LFYWQFLIYLYWVFCIICLRIYFNLNCINVKLLCVLLVFNYLLLLYIYIYIYIYIYMWCESKRLCTLIRIISVYIRLLLTIHKYSMLLKDYLKIKYSYNLNMWSVISRRFFLKIYSWNHYSTRRKGLRFFFSIL